MLDMFFKRLAAQLASERTNQSKRRLSKHQRTECCAFSSLTILELTPNTTTLMEEESLTHGFKAVTAEKGLTLDCDGGVRQVPLLCRNSPAHVMTRDTLTVTQHLSTWSML